MFSSVNHPPDDFGLQKGAQTGVVLQRPDIHVLYLIHPILGRGPVEQGTLLAEAFSDLANGTARSTLTICFGGPPDGAFESLARRKKVEFVQLDPGEVSPIDFENYSSSGNRVDGLWYDSRYSKLMEELNRLSALSGVKILLLHNYGVTPDHTELQKKEVDLLIGAAKERGFKIVTSNMAFWQRFNLLQTDEDSDQYYERMAKFDLILLRSPDLDTLTHSMGMSPPDSFMSRVRSVGIPAPKILGHKIRERPLRERRPIITISTGGGEYGEELCKTAISAFFALGKLSVEHPLRKHRWIIIPAKKFQDASDRLSRYIHELLKSEESIEEVRLEHLRSGHFGLSCSWGSLLVREFLPRKTLLRLLSVSKASVSHAGSNALADAHITRCPSIFVPHPDEVVPEQRIAVDYLQKHNHFPLLYPDKLSPEWLLEELAEITNPSGLVSSPLDFWNPELNGQDRIIQELLNLASLDVAIHT